MANSVDPDQTAPERAVWSASALVGLDIIVQDIGVKNFRMFTVLTFKVPITTTPDYILIYFLARLDEVLPPVLVALAKTLMLKFFM